MYKAIVVDTLGKLRDDGYRLWASCEGNPACHHSSALDLDKLIAKFGADFDVVDHRDELIRHLVCRKCGSKSIEIRLSPPTSSQTGGGTTRW